MHPQVPAEQRTQHLWCGECFVSERLDIDDAEREADVPLSDTPVQEAAAP